MHTDRLGKTLCIDRPESSRSVIMDCSLHGGLICRASWCYALGPDWIIVEDCSSYHQHTSTPWELKIYCLHNTGRPLLIHIVPFGLVSAPPAFQKKDFSNKTDRSALSKELLGRHHCLWNFKGNAWQERKSHHSYLRDPGLQIILHLLCLTSRL